LPAENVKLMVFDVDGVLTDGSLYYGPEGEAWKRFSVKDGLGLKLLRKARIEVAIVSARESAAVARRLAELDVKTVIQGAEDKLAAVREVIHRHGVREDETGFVGDDLNDIPVLRRVGFTAAPPDAAPEVRSLVEYVTKAAAGHGCAREIAERVLKAQNRWGAVIESFLS
jgi:3-deoxy-D-manno-octulosonate 8-phosphate phosphatase (KDO 8-P phosphatase)